MNISIKKAKTSVNYKFDNFSECILYTVRQRKTKFTC
jgi:hypothetical protein